MPILNNGLQGDGKKLRKHEVAIVALLSAIKCYELGNHVSAIILAGAARQILNDLCIAKKLQTTLDKICEATQNPTGQVHIFIAKTYNSLRHADRDPDQIINVSKDEAEMLITLASADLVRLNLPVTDEIKSILIFVKSFKLK